VGRVVRRLSLFLPSAGNRGEWHQASAPSILRRVDYAKVKGKIVDDALVKDGDIKVEKADHVVTLKGTVVSADAKARAGEIARATDGVQQVVNLLVLETKKT
jgi:BON domain